MKNKKGLIALVAVLGIVLITAGATYAWFSYSKSGTKENTISAGSITFHYQEGAQGLTLDDAMPMTDNQGMAQTDYFDFTITSSTSNTVDIPYYITARRSGTGTNMDGVVKVYLTKVDNNNNETPIEVVSGKTIAKVSELGSYINNQGINTPATEKSLYNDKVWAGTENYEQKYRLRMWIDDAAQFIVQQEGQPDQYPYQGKTYTLTVNVYSSGVSVDQSAVDLRKNVNINSLQLGNDILVSTNDTYSTNVEIQPGETNVSKTLTVDTVNPNTKISVTEASALNNDRSKIEKLSTNKTLAIGLGANDYNIVVTSEDGSTSKTYRLSITGINPSYEVTVTGNNVTLSVNTIMIPYNGAESLTITPDSGYYISEGSCTNGYIVTGLATGTTATSAQTITINNNDNAEGSMCVFNTTPITYTISYTQSKANINPASYNITSETFTLTNPTSSKSYCTFAGWSGTDLTGSNNMNVSINKGSIGNRSYVANWNIQNSVVLTKTSSKKFIATYTNGELTSCAVDPLSFSCESGTANVTSTLNPSDCISTGMVNISYECIMDDMAANISTSGPGFSSTLSCP